jgi:hypothetical protein
LILIKLEVTLVMEQNLPDSARYQELDCIGSICAGVGMDSKTVGNRSGFAKTGRLQF